MARSKSERLLEKQRVYDDGIKGDHVLLHLDSCHPEVEVPLHLKNNPALTLKISDLFQGHIEHNEHRVLAQLKFNNEYFCCILPWDAVWSITDSQGKNTIWPEDMPKELLVNTLKEKLRSWTGKIFSSKSEETDPDSDAESAAPETSDKTISLDEERAKKRRSVIKRIK